MVNNFKGRQPENGHMHRDSVARMPMINIPRVESPLEKVASVQVTHDFHSRPHSTVISACAFRKCTATTLAT